MQVHALTQSNEGSLWNKVADLPATFSTAVTLHGQLLVIGGKDSKYKLISTAVHMYQPTNDSWEVGKWKRMKRKTETES